MGVKFYDFSNRKIEFGQEVGFVPVPDHHLDSNCVRVIALSGQPKALQLGNVDATAAEWLSPMMRGPFSIKG
jgi:hypothetical protein